MDKSSRFLVCLSKRLKNKQSITFKSAKTGLKDTVLRPLVGVWSVFSAGPTGVCVGHAAAQQRLFVLRNALLMRVSAGRPRPSGGLLSNYLCLQRKELISMRLTPVNPHMWHPLCCSSALHHACPEPLHTLRMGFSRTFCSFLSCSGVSSRSSVSVLMTGHSEALMGVWVAMVRRGRRLWNVDNVPHAHTETLTPA